MASNSSILNYAGSSLEDLVNLIEGLEKERDDLSDSYERLRVEHADEVASLLAELRDQ